MINAGLDPVNTSHGAVMAIVRVTFLLSFGLFQTLAFAQGKEAKPAAAPGQNADTVVFLAQANLERLVMIEARQEHRRLLTIVPVGAFKRGFSLFIAQKHLANKDQLRSAVAAFLPSIFEFSSPRLAIYEDRNPCSDGDESKSNKPTISVAGMPFFELDSEALAVFEILNVNKRMPAKTTSGLSRQEVAELTALGKAGYGIVKVTYTPSKESSKAVKVMPALHLAWEDSSAPLRSLVVGKLNTIVERLYLSPESVEVLDGVQLSSFPTGIELPPEAAAVFPSIYTDWAAAVLAKEQVIRGFTGPTNRCELCYDKPPTLEVLRSAGVFWQPKLPDVNPSILRGQKVDTPSPALDTWLSRHILQKPKNKQLLISGRIERSSVGRSFIEQGSVQRPFLGEIFCPAMEGYKKSLIEQRKKTIVALNSLSGWNEEKLKTRTGNVGAVRPTWFQEHWENKP